MTAPFQRAFREELLRAARREQQRRRWRVRGAITAALAAIAGTLTLLWPSPATAEIDVRVKDGYVEVRLLDRDTTSADVIAALERHHVNVTVTLAPTGPSLVGLFTSVSMGSGAASVVKPLAAPAHAAGYIGFRAPVGFPGLIELQLGRKAKPGESYEAFVDVFAPREPLHCAGVLGHRLDTVVPRLRGLDVQVVQETPDGPRTEVRLDQALRGEAAGWYVTRGGASSATDVRLTVEAEPGPEAHGC